MRYGLTTKVGRPPAPPARLPARRTDIFSKSDNNTLRQILAEGKKNLRKKNYLFRGGGAPLEGGASLEGGAFDLATPVSMAVSMAG